MIKKTLRPRKCKNVECKQWFTPKKPWEIVCCEDCAIEFWKQDKKKKEAKQIAKEIRKQREQEKLGRAKHREQKRNLLTLEQVCIKLTTEVNACIRERDRDKGCISCGKAVIDAGHLYHAGSKYRTSRLRFHYLNVNGQCDQCNRFVGGGNEGEYIEGFIYRYGKPALEELREYKRWVDRGNEPTLHKDQVWELIKIHKQWLKQLQAKNELGAIYE